MESLNRSERRRILIVSNLYPPHVIGGAELVAHRQAAQLRERGCLVTVFAGWVAPQNTEGTLGVEDVDGIRVYRTPVVSFDPDDNFHIPSVAARFQSVLLAERPDIVHFHNLAGLGYSLIPLVHRHGIASVVTLHDHAGYCFRATALKKDGTLCDNTEACGVNCTSTIRGPVKRSTIPMRARRDYVAWVLAHADYLISPSAHLAKSYLEAGAATAERMKVISNGIDLQRFTNVMPRSADWQPNQVMRFLFVGYLGEHKGVLELLEAAKIITGHKELTKRWSLTLAGAGHLAPEVEKFIAEKICGDAVSYLGRVDRDGIIQELDHADVLVLPSRWPENEPVVIMEASVVGRAQIVTNIGGMVQMVQADVTGQTVPPLDANALAVAMMNYIQKPELAHQHGMAALARRDGLSDGVTISAIEDLYAEVLASPRTAGPRDNVIICAGNFLAADIVDMCNRLYLRESHGNRLRLIWHGWLEADAWPRATALWNWSSDPDRAAIERALRAGVKIIGPAECQLIAGLQTSFHAAYTYDTLAEAEKLLIAASRRGKNLSAANGRSFPAGIISLLASASHYHFPVPSAIT